MQEAGGKLQQGGTEAVFAKLWVQRLPPAFQEFRCWGAVLLVPVHGIVLPTCRNTSRKLAAPTNKSTPNDVFVADSHSQ